jgi:hypothetical protein
MVDVFNGNDSVHFGAQTQLATIDVQFRFSRQQIPKNSWQQLDNWKYESGAVHLLTVSSPSSLLYPLFNS